MDVVGLLLPSSVHAAFLPPRHDLWARALRGRALNATLDPNRDNEDVANDLGDLARAEGHGNGRSRAQSRGKRGTKRKAAVAMAGLFDF